MSQETLVVEAVRDGTSNAILRLLQERPELIHFRDDARKTLAHYAIEARQLEALAILLDHGVPLGTEDDGYMTALTMAAEASLGEYVRLLLVYGSDATMIDSDLQTPLHIAAMYDNGKGDVARCLLAYGADTHACDICDNTPLHIAAAYGSEQVVKDLLAAGANVNAVNAIGSTPLHMAAPNGYNSIVQILIEYGADINATDANGNTPLIDAAFVSQSSVAHYAVGDAESQANVVHTLVMAGAAVDLVNSQGETAIFGAVRNGYECAVGQLLSANAKATRTNRFQETLLHVAARATIKSLPIWQQLVHAGVNIHAVDRFERTCYNIWMSRPKIVRDDDADNTADSVVTEGHEPVPLQDDSDVITQFLEATLMVHDAV